MHSVLVVPFDHWCPEMCCFHSTKNQLFPLTLYFPSGPPQFSTGCFKSHSVYCIKWVSGYNLQRNFSFSFWFPVWSSGTLIYWMVQTSLLLTAKASCRLRSHQTNTQIVYFFSDSVQLLVSNAVPLTFRPSPKVGNGVNSEHPLWCSTLSSGWEPVSQPNILGYSFTYLTQLPWPRIKCLLSSE